MDQAVTLTTQESGTIAADIAMRVQAASKSEAQEFCKHWPDAKNALAVLSSFIEPLKPDLAKLLGEVIKWGDRAYDTGCTIKPPPPQP